jgi:hypothetical protein
MVLRLQVAFILSTNPEPQGTENSKLEVRFNRPEQLVQLKLASNPNLDCEHVPIVAS